MITVDRPSPSMICKSAFSGNIFTVGSPPRSAPHLLDLYLDGSSDLDLSLSNRKQNGVVCVHDVRSGLTGLYVYCVFTLDPDSRVTLTTQSADPD